MHESVLGFVATHIQSARDADVLDVGSYDINGSARTVLEEVARSYLGVDLVEGPGVDEVADGENLPEEWTNKFGMVVCLEVGEHCLRPWKLVSELVRVCKPGGTILFSMRGFNERGAFFFHNPPDRWRTSVDGVTAMFNDTGVLPQVEEDPQAHGVLVSALKPY